jgi:3-keto-L-gulonate-6-phosphate decarboxylase
MKKIIIGLFTILFVTGIAYGQKDNTDIDIVQSLFGRSKRLIIEGYIQLDDQEKKSFWRIYDQYEEKRKAIEKEGFILLKEYADNYRTMDGAEARKLIVYFMKNMDGYNTLYKVYFRKMEKIIGSLKAATFIQLETFVQTALQANLQSQVPVIGELERLDSQNTERKPEKDFGIGQRL